MKTSAVGMVSAAILIVVAGFGIGIAQAGGHHADRPVLSFEDQAAFEQDSSSSTYVENRPVLAFDDSSSPYAENRPVLSFDDQELPQLAKSPADDFQPQNSIETGSLPAGNSNADLDPFSRGGP